MSQGSGTAPVRDVIVVGAGPAGLASAIAAKQAGLDCEVIERGVVVNSILHFPTNMGFFTTPELLEIGGLPFVTPYQKPTRDEALRYYRRAVDTYDLTIDLGHDVEAIHTVQDEGGRPRLAVDPAEAEGFLDHVRVGASRAPGVRAPRAQELAGLGQPQVERPGGRSPDHVRPRRVGA